LVRNYLSGPSCYPCGTYCLTCDSSGCITCNADSYYLNGVNCVLCSTAMTNCVTCSSISTCLTCTSSSFVYSGHCAVCSSFPILINCQSCSDQITCTSCNPGYYINSTLTCSPCSNYDISC
jgi:hypothetical protein